jgi:hypothetical protein
MLPYDVFGGQQVRNSNRHSSSVHTVHVPAVALVIAASSGLHMHDRAQTHSYW